MFAIPLQGKGSLRARPRYHKERLCSQPLVTMYRALLRRVAAPAPTTRLRGPAQTGTAARGHRWGTGHLMTCCSERVLLEPSYQRRRGWVVTSRSQTRVYVMLRMTTAHCLSCAFFTVLYL